MGRVPGAFPRARADEPTIAFATLPALLAAAAHTPELAAAARLVGPEAYLYVGGSCDLACRSRWSSCVVMAIKIVACLEIQCALWIIFLAVHSKFSAKSMSPSTIPGLRFL